MNLQSPISRRDRLFRIFRAEKIGSQQILQYGLSLSIGFGLAIILGYLIAYEAWPFPLPVVLLIPGLILFTRDPFVAVLTWLLVFPFFVQSPSVTSRYIYWILHRAMIPIALVSITLAGWLSARKQQRPVRLGIPEFMFLVFLVVVITNIFFSEGDPIQELFGLYDRIFIPFCMYMLVRLFAPGVKELKRFLWIGFFTVLSQSVIGLLSWFAPRTLPAEWTRLQGERTVGTFGDPAIYTSVLIFLSLLLLHYAVNQSKSRSRTILVLVFGLAFFSVFFSFSRGSWLGGAVVLLALIPLYPKTIIRLVIVGSVLIVAVGGSVLADEITWAWERLTTERTADDRVIQIYAALNMIKEKPFFGWGYGDYDLYDRQFQTRVGELAAVTTDATSHNTYLTLLVELGLVAFLLYMFPPAYWLVMTIRSWRSMPEKGFYNRRLVLLLWLALLNMFIVSNFLDMISFNPFGTTVWWMILGLIATIVYPYLNPVQSTEFKEQKQQFRTFGV